MRFTAIIVFGILLTGCSPLYVPNARNTPVFDKAGEVQLSAGYATGMDIQTAYSITENIGVMVNYFNTRQEGNNQFAAENNNYRFSHRLVEFGAGYGTVSRKTESFNLYSELFAGIGWATGSGVNNAANGFLIFQPEDTLYVQTNYWRYFIQPVIAFRFPRADIILSCRFSAVDFYRTNLISTSNNTLEVDQTKLFLEPSIGCRIYTQNRKFFLNLQGGFNLSLSKEIHYEYTEYIPFSATLGVGLKLNFSEK